MKAVQYVAWIIEVAMKRLSALFSIVLLLSTVGNASPSSLKRISQTAKQEASQTPANVTSQPKPEKKDDCGCEAKAPPDVFAIVNGVKIAAKDVDEPISGRIKELEGRVVESRKNQLEREINSRLLDAEAKRRGMISERVLDREVTQTDKILTDVKAPAVYDPNRRRIGGE